ncbi:DUF58 domain-containing protein [Halobacterium sp. KA-6]|uniref:DUF58 domain-containing protein n=1 Tax=Halobacterium sp. KA-6 TaxID=2896368 RepID=UPI001E3C150D|nr:DUF58 domain-containing protein [Halobacterium sp. KA-6]MCD2204891.1 DUF58 domain-containing protein [Halobacterium sp. KA-6]
MTAVRRTYRWQMAGIAALLLVAVGFLYASAMVVAAAAIPVAFAAYDALSVVPADAELQADRKIGMTAASPGERVPVTLTVTNTGDAAVPDLRVIDGVPSELAVVSGTPRVSAPLRAGDTASTTYEVVAKRGQHEFDAPVARGRSFAGSEQATTTLEPGGDTSFEGLRAIDSPPTKTPIHRAGTQPTDQGGPGLEFHRTRDYQPNDPLNRLNWRQYAKTGELSTVEFREEHATRTAIIVDARKATRVSPAPGHPTAPELNAYVSARLHDALATADVDTLLTAVGLPNNTTLTVGPHDLPWVTAETPTDAADLLDAVEDTATNGPNRHSMTPTPPRADVFDLSMPAAGEAIRRRLPPRAEVVVVTPLLDDWPLELAGGLRPYDYPVTVVSPDVTDRTTSAGNLVALHRDLRQTRLTDAGFAVVDWQLDTPIDTALARSLTHLTH